MLLLVEVQGLFVTRVGESGKHEHMFSYTHSYQVDEVDNDGLSLKFQTSL